MNKRKKTLRQLVVALLLLCTIGLPIQNIVLANELSTTEDVVTEGTESATTAEANTSNSESMESESVSPSEKEAESTEITSSETLLEESKGLMDIPEVDSSEITEASSATQQSEERLSTKATSSGTFPNGSTSAWTFDDTTGELSISAGTLVNPNQSLEDLTGVPANQIKSIVFEGQVVASGSLLKLFYGASGLTSLDLSNLDTNQVTIMNSMFEGASSLTSLDVSNLDTSNVVSMMYMFTYTSSLTSLDVSNFDTSQVTNMGAVFSHTSSLTSLDVSNFDTSQATYMAGMFAYTSLTSLDLSNFDTSQATTTLSMLDMFRGASKLQNLTLGSQFHFATTDAKLPDPTPTAKYTGEWQNVGSGTVDKPKGSFIGTANELMSTYDGSTMADTYVWQSTLLEVNVQDSILMVGDTWNPANNFLSALDSVGDPVDFKDITVTGSVDTTQPGLYTVTYSYGGITSTATITVLETMPASWINFFVDGTNVRAIPGSLLSTPEWDLTTGLWTGWNPGTIKVPTDKLPSAPVKEGYTFKGWQDTTGTIVDFSTLEIDLNSTTEFNFTAGYEKNTYNVTFNVDGRQEQQTVLFDELISEPTTPTKDGYLFTGWYDSPTGGNKWDFSADKMPAKNVELYAHFKELVVVTPGVDPVTPSVNPPTTPGEGPNVVSPTTPGSGGNQPPSNGSGSNTGNTTAPSPTTSQRGKLAKLGENSSLLLQGFGLLLVLSGLILFWKKRKRTHL
ncbi:BspA family leucine-rich repeat surface protein [Listeria monocytogenes]|nr:BspA family leucine-rich repeat surface protein [Listeria monocytogenes]EJU4184630.1 BspA family leucine-rich repeat surface protein [Listeria monocytogenes]EKZ0247842.1 BspA family leucine-rich repeat surface protein [Listeria monocytogenes]EMB2358418.1 BspA family leucine-rich repeat surface protein [Listeria monocytogenes]